MSKNAKKIMMFLSIVEREKGKKLIKTLNEKQIRMHIQCVGFGTAPTEMMDIFGLGSNDKDVVISLGAEKAVKALMADFGNSFASHSKFGGLMMVIKPSAINRIVTEILSHNLTVTEETGDNVNMKNQHHHNLILITVNQGYAEEVMQTARQAGATGGTVIRGRIADSDSFLELAPVDMEEEREIISILAPATVTEKIMEDVNEKFGFKCEAHGILCAVPVEKAYKI